MQKKQVIYIIAVVLIAAILIVIGVIVINKQKKEAERDKTGIEKTTDIQEKAAKAIEEAVTNPAEKIPSANPYEKVKNPFRDAYKNPFSK